MKNPYEVLGIPASASDTDIKSAFRRLAKETHPDLNGNDAQKTQRFREVAEAYAILSDPIKRSYWEENNRQQQVCDGPTAYDRDVRMTAADIERYIHALYEEVKPYKDAAKRSAWAGLAWLIGGLVVTFGSYAAAVSSGGGTYVITWGAILFGGIQAIRSFANYAKISNAVSEAEAEMWRAFK